MKKQPGYPALLDHDVRVAFPDDESVTEALRVILKAAKNLATRTSPTTKTKRRKYHYEEKTNCRVLAMSRGKILYKTPMLTSSPRKRSEIVSNQRRLLHEKHSGLKNAKDVNYVLQWREGNRWVNDKG